MRFRRTLKGRDAPSTVIGDQPLESTLLIVEPVRRAGGITGPHQRAVVFEGALVIIASRTGGASSRDRAARGRPAGWRRLRAGTRGHGRGVELDHVGRDFNRLKLLGVHRRPIPELHVAGLVRPAINRRFGVAAWLSQPIRPRGPNGGGRLRSGSGIRRIRCMGGRIRTRLWRAQRQKEKSGDDTHGEDERAPYRPKLILLIVHSDADYCCCLVDYLSRLLCPSARIGGLRGPDALGRRRLGSVPPQKPHPSLRQLLPALLYLLHPCSRPPARGKGQERASL